MAQEGTVGILYGAADVAVSAGGGSGVLEGASMVGTAVSAGFDVGTAPVVGASTVAPAVAGTSVAGLQTWFA